MRQLILLWKFAVNTFSYNFSKTHSLTRSQENKCGKRPLDHWKTQPSGSQC